ncbi:peptidylprolyl isomerase [Paraglaciecola aestuariivivens]
MFKKSSLLICSAFILLCCSFSLRATVVEIRTSEGTIVVNLFDQTTPKTVENFLSYVNAGAYANSVVHRSVSNFVIQGGGYSYTGPVEVNNFSLDRIPTGTPVENEPKLSNVRGTIAMAKGSNPDSATSQWFINLEDNSSSLDVATNAGGFTVFGQVIGDGMQVVDSIASAITLNAGGAFAEIPIQNYTQTDVDNEVPITDEHLFVVTDIVVTDQNEDSAANLQPKANTLVNQQSPTPSTESDSGGSMGWMLLAALLLLGRRTK